MLGFSFNGTRCEQYGIVMCSKNRPVLPEPKIVTEEVPARNGSYDFSAANPFGRTMYKDRDISIECSFISGGVPQTRAATHEIAAWLACGEAQLMFDDEPEVYYLARVANRIDLSQQISKVGIFNVNFRCRPFAISKIPSGEPGGDNVFTVTNSAVTPGSGMNFTVLNRGSAHVRPLVQFVGTYAQTKIFHSKGLVQLPSIATGTIAVDCERMKVTQNNANISLSCSGTFFELAPGNNTFSLQQTGVGGSMSFKFNYLYF